MAAVNHKKPVVEIRSIYATLEDAPYFSGTEDMVRELLANNDFGKVWFHIINGDGSKEEVSQEEWDAAFAE